MLSDERETNLSFAKAAVALLSRGEGAIFILDFDAMYSSNSDRIFGEPSKAHAAQAEIRVPDPESPVERELEAAFATEPTVLIVDSLNTLHHALSQEDGTSRSRKLSFSVASLSYFAKSSKSTVILSMYVRERLGKHPVGRSMSKLSDATAYVQVKGPTLSMTCERGTLWPGGVFSIRIL